MKSHNEVAENEKVLHRQLAEEALRRYGLQGASLTLISDVDSVLYKVSLPQEPGLMFHPYLGRVEGQRFLLRIEEAVDRRVARTYSELVLLAALLRETDLALPEPVPACSGELVPDLWVDGLEQPRQCVLFRWASAPFPEAALHRAAQWQAN